MYGEYYLFHSDVQIDEPDFVDQRNGMLLRAQVQFASFHQSHYKTTSLRNELYLMTLVNLCE